MADYFTQFSFVIPMTPEQGNWFTQVHALATELIGHAQDGEARKNIEGSQDIVSAALGLAEKRDGDPCLQVVHDDKDSAIWVSSEDSGDVDYTADLVQAFLRRFDLDLVVSFEWANTCSKPQLDAFGGGAVVISRRNADWFSTGTFVETAKKVETERLRLKPDDELKGVDLDDDVYDIASGLGADAHNNGIGAQLDFLLEHGWNPPEHLLREEPAAPALPKCAVSPT
jgi:hypothetical protein